MTVVQLLFIFIGLPASIIMGLFKVAYIYDNDSFEKNFNSTLFTFFDSIFRLVPLYNITSTLIVLIFQKLLSIGRNTNAYEWVYHSLGGWLITVIGTFILYTALIFLFEFLSSRSKRTNILQIHENTPSVLKDDDVINEEERVRRELPNDSAVHIEDARKAYNGALAVKNVSFAVKNSEIFALLGVNGAGKTTMFKMITLQEKPDCGKFYLRGINMHTSMNNRVKHYIGYCPQEDVLIDHMTVLEHLNYYATIKGIPSHIRPQIVSLMLQAFNFGENTDKRAWKLSGGNKRKLCTAIALLGRPEILLLDEPTTGLDPQNRRAVWDIIHREVTGEIKSSVILTTHSMEEAEALSTKIAIMVSGDFRCFGSNQHLKTKYGNSYDMELTFIQPLYSDIQGILGRSQIPENSMIITFDQACTLLNRIGLHEESKKLEKRNPRAVYVFQLFDSNVGVDARTLIEFALVERNIITVMNSIQAKFPGCRLTEETAMKLKIQVPRVISNKQLRFSDLFKYTEELKTSGCIKDYAVYETTLEHIFQYFAKQVV